MSWSGFLRNLTQSSHTNTKPQRKQPYRARPALEMLEDRVVPYTTTGNIWPHPQLISISFMPDGTPMSAAVGSNIKSNLFSTFNAKFGSTAAWQNQILKAAQVWAQQTNINFTVVSDSGASSGSGNYEQGDPTFGDIRIGGYAYTNSSLATCFQPPQANNYSLAGDISFNTSATFNIGSTYDLFTVACHEFGHALGMDHTTATTSAVMYPSYTGMKPTLNSDDIAGIRSIYSGGNARSLDAFAAGGAHNTAATASDITATINQNALTAVVQNLDITTTGQVEYLTFVAPANTMGPLTVTVQSRGLSLLSPKMTLYASDGSTVLGTANGLNKYGTTLTVTTSNVSAGQKFYVKVQGADTTAFSTGAYALTLNFGSGAAPAVALPNTQTVNGNPLSGSGGDADNPGKGDSYLLLNPLITGISPDTGSSSTDGVTSAQRLMVFGVAPAGMTVQVAELGAGGGLLGGLLGLGYTTIGTAFTGTDGQWIFNYTNTVLSDGTYSFRATGQGLVGAILGLLASSYTVVVNTKAPPAPTISGFTPDATGVQGDGDTNCKSPTLNGTAAANSIVTVFLNGQFYDTALTNGSGGWSYQVKDALADGTYTFTATATELAGNVSSFSKALKVTIHTQPPNAPTITGYTKTTNVGWSGSTTTVTLTGKGTAGDVVTILDGNTVLGKAVVTAAGTWSFKTPSLATGKHDFRAFQTDPFGNSSLFSNDLFVTI
jgi:hypothetical protein